jgi:hypothetical protein
MRRILLNLSLIALVSGAVSRARADLVITIGDLTLAPGGAGTIDVTITSDATPVDTLDSFGFEFRITGTGPTRLEFTATQPDPFALTNPDYVFLGSSSDQQNGLTLGSVSTTTVPNDTYIGGDQTGVGGSAVSIVGTKLIAQLSVTTVTSLPPMAGDSFTITLVPGINTDFSSGGSSIGFTSRPGTVLVSAVPEPRSIHLLCLGGLVLATTIPRRRVEAAPPL